MNDEYADESTGEKIRCSHCRSILKNVTLEEWAAVLGYIRIKRCNLSEINQLDVILLKEYCTRCGVINLFAAFRAKIPY